MRSDRAAQRSDALSDGADGPVLYPAPAHQEQRETINEKPLFYLVDWLPPDFGAVGQYGLIFAREMASAGRCVKLIGLSRRRSTTVREALGAGNLEVTRLRAQAVDKSTHGGRLAWTVKTNLRLIWQVVRSPESRGAELLFTGSPPFMLFFSLIVRATRGTRLIYRITDFYPEVLFAAWGRKPGVFAIFEKLTWFFRRRVDEFQVLGEDQRKLLIAGGVRPDQITLKRDVTPVAILGEEAPMVRPAALKGHKILLYSGNFGVAHEVKTIIDGMIEHHRHGSGQFGLWLNASGAATSEVKAALEAERVPVALTAPASLEMLPSLLTSADAHLVSLKAEFSGYVLPSKIYGCLSSRRPILYVGPTSSDVHLLCQQQRPADYKHVEIGDVIGFARALDRLAAFAP